MSTDTTRDRAREVISEAILDVPVNTGDDTEFVTEHILAALADDGIQLVGPGEVVVDQTAFAAAIRSQLDPAPDASTV